jgi:rhomboid protease GluP
MGICVLLYAISILLNTDAALNPSGGFLSIGAPDMKSLYLLGMTGGYAWTQGYIWTLLSASFLHGGLLHIFFNLSWLSTLGKIFGSFFGMNRLVIVYVFTGVSGFVLSNLLNNAPTIGASCSIFGIMGALITFSLRRGGDLGRRLRSQVWAWVIIGLIFGFVVEGVNNYGHIGGLLGGFAIGMLLPARERVAEESWVQPLAFLLIFLSLISVGLSVNAFWTVLQLDIPVR